MTKPLQSIRRCLFLISLPTVFITFALPLRAEDLGASAFEIGLLYSFFTAAVFVVRPLTGIGLDWLGRRPFFLLAASFYLLANAFYVISDSVNGLFIARILQGLGFAMLAITTDTMTADLTEAENRATAMGGNIASKTRGGMAGGFIGFGLVGAMPVYAWVYSFAAFSVVAFLTLILAFFIIPETSQKRHDKEKRTRFTAPQGYFRILAIIFFAAFAGAIIQPYYLIYLRGRFDLELYFLALAFLPMGVASAVLPVWLGRVTEKFGRIAAIGAGLVLSAVFYALIPNIAALPLVIAAFTASAIGAVLVDLTKNALIADLSSAATAGRAFGLAALAAGGGAALGPLAGGIVYDAMGGDMLFYVAGAILLGAFALTRIVNPNR